MNPRFNRPPMKPGMYQGMYPGINPIMGTNDNRLIGGGFLGPFLLGGLTGGLVAPYFYGRPNYYYYPPYYYRSYEKGPIVW